MQTYYSEIEKDVDMRSRLYAFTRRTLTNRLEGPTNRQTVFIQPVYVEKMMMVMAIVMSTMMMMMMSTMIF